MNRGERELGHPDTTYVQRETVYKYNDFEVKRSMTDANNNLRIAESLEEELGHAAEELITGDSDDAPLSEEAVVEMRGMTSNARRLAPI